MIPTVMHILAACVACYGLWRLARRSRNPIIAAGFLVRAFAAQALFWISWLELPLSRSMQIGNGLWFFAADAAWYFDAAATALAGRPITDDGFVHLTTLQLVTFGSVVSGSILLNCAAYLGTALLIENLGARSTYKNVALLAFAFAPSNILWSSQPGKDSLFYFLLVLLVKLLDEWQRSARVVTMFAIGATVYAISEMRAYMGIFATVLIVPFVILLAAQDRRWRNAIAGLLLALLLAEATIIGSGENIRRMHWRIASPQRARDVFEDTAGATVIRPGPLLARGSTASHRARILATGAVAMFVPRTLAQGADLVRIGGGRGLWSFVEIDTIVFDAMIVIAIAWCIAALRNGLRPTPLFVFLSLLLLVTSIPMLYIVTNFGTMFRLRQMLYVLALLLPLTLPTDNRACA